MLIGTLIKLPVLIYLIVNIVSVPAIDSINYNVIPGAHRGEWGEYRENSLDAMKVAVDNSDYKFIEFDVQYTEDQKIIVFHDGSLLRTQKKLANVQELTYEALIEKSEYYIPTYEEVMEIIKDKKKINIEIKSSDNFELDKQLTDYIIEDCKKRGILQNIMISSISRDVVRYIHENYPEIKIGQIFFITYSTYFHYNFTNEMLYNEIEETGANYVMLHGINIKNINQLVELKPANKTIVFWYLNKEIYIVCVDERDRLW